VDGELRRSKQVDRDDLWLPNQSVGLNIHRRLPDLCRFGDEFVVLIEPALSGLLTTHPTHVGRLTRKTNAALRQIFSEVLTTDGEDIKTKFHQQGTWGNCGATMALKPTRMNAQCVSNMIKPDRMSLQS